MEMYKKQKHIKHIKKYRGVLSKTEQRKLREKARSKAKTILMQKHKKEYIKIYEPIYKKLRREYLKKMKGG